MRQRNKKSAAAYPLFLSGAFLAMGAAFFGYTLLHNRDALNKSDNKRQSSATRFDSVPNPNQQRWKKYTFNPPGNKYGFSIDLPETYYLHEQIIPNQPNAFFTIFPTDEEKKRINMETVMEIEFFPGSGQVNFASPQDTEWDRIYHGRVVKSFQLITNP